MKPSPSPSRSPHLLLLLLMTLILIQASSSESVINSTCKSMAAGSPNVKYGFCVTSLQAAPASRCASGRGLVSISIRSLRYNVTDTRCLIKQLLRERKWDPFAARCLADCLDLYSDAIPSVKQAMKSFNAARYDDANVQVSSVMDAASTCQDGFADRPGITSPLTNRNAHVLQIGAMVLSLMDIIRTGSGRRF